MTDWFREFGVDSLTKLNHLSVEENRELFASRDVMRIIELIIDGLTRK